MNSSRMSSFLDPASATRNTISKQKTETIRIAKEQEKAIHEKLARNNHPIPKYEFLELIGKGAYGRVFKCLDQTENRVVALKVIDVDSHDYKANAREKDDSIEVTMHEIKVLKQLKDANAKNVNIIFDAFQIHSQLWIVNEYCPGGSLRTLMRGTGDRLENKFIVPIARELAIALKAIHDGGIIHRDVKAANVMIHESGRLQVIDFGVAGILQTSVDKRSTVIGTPHWMAPELHKIAPREGLNYGTEVDVWAYGCTLHEIATGLPPYPRTQPGRMLGVTLGRSPPRLDKLDHDEKLCDLVAFVLEAKPTERPSMEAVLRDPYVLDSEHKYPTQSLAELVKIFYRWERSGGQRQSLFINAGAPAAEFPATIDEEEEDWNFSTTATFETENSEGPFDPIKISYITSSGDLESTVENRPNDAEDVSSYNHLNSPPTVVPSEPSSCGSDTEGLQSEAQTPTDDQSPVEKLNTEERVKRGENALKGLFNEDEAPYKYEVKADFAKHKRILTLGPKSANKSASHRSSDLPLRDESVQSSVHRKEFDADQVRSANYDNLPNIDLANVGTIKANRMNRFLDNMGQDDKAGSSYYFGAHPDDDKRATKDWTFPSTPSKDAAQDHKRATIEWGFPPEMQAGADDPQPMPERPPLKHTVTAPVGDIRQSAVEMIDLDALYDDPLYDSNILRTAPASDDEAFARMDSRDQTEAHRFSDDDDDEDDKNLRINGSNGTRTLSGPSMSEDERTIPLSTISTTSSITSSESDNEYDPFASNSDSSDDETNVETNANLNDLDHKTNGKSRLATAIGSYPQRDASLWEMYDPGVNPAPETKPYPMGLPSRPGDPDFPLANGLQTQFAQASHIHENGVEERPPTSATAAVAAARNFPEIVPPNAESLMAGAPPGALEAELRRLVVDWNKGSDVLGDLFTDAEGRGSATSEGVNGRSNGHPAGVAAEVQQGES